MTEDILKQRINQILSEKLEHMRMHVAVQIDEARVNVVKARVRGGKLQRRKKVSNVKGYTIRGGKLVRMSSKERLKRKLARKRASAKIKAKQARAIMKRRRSLQKRKAAGL